MALWEFHPALVHFPIAFLLGGIVLDLAAWWRGREGWAQAATGLLIAGVASGVVAAGAGLLAFWTVPAHTEGAHKWMWWHLGLAATALVLFAGITFARWRRRATAVARVIGLAGALMLLVAAYLGGMIVYHGGAGIDPSLLAPEVRGGHSHAGEETSPHRSPSAENRHGASGSEGDHVHH